MNQSDKSASQLISTDSRARLALHVIATLHEAGFVAYLAGGCVRDALLGKRPKDYDVATSARPDQIQTIFGARRTIAIGAAFGVISVLPNRELAALCREPVEVATFRSDGAYTDGRRPDVVHFSSPELDALRRDFTINGMFFDPLEGTIIDFVGGREDLQREQIRAIGDPVARFGEDKLRLLRAIRFATTYRFSIEDHTWNAIREHASDVVVCSGERIGAEMRRLLTSPHAGHGIELLRNSLLADAIMPKIARHLDRDEMLGMVQQLLRLLRETNLSSRLAALALAAAPAEQEALTQLTEFWRLANEEADAARVALTCRDQLLGASQLPWSQLQPLLVQRYRDQAVDLAKAIGQHAPQYEPSLQHIDRQLSLPPHQLDPPPLLSGGDLIAMGLRPGPQFKSLLSRLRQAQLDNEIDSRDQAIAFIQEQQNAM